MSSDLGAAAGTPLLARCAGRALAGYCKTMTSLEIVWMAPWAPECPRIFYVNHASHADAALVWAAFPPPLRPRVRPVAATEYWVQGPVRRFMAARVLRAVMVDRNLQGRGGNALQRMEEALRQGDSLILFPEGTRNPGAGLLPFKPGLFHLHRNCPEAEIQPVWVDNPRRGMPKGALLPIPLLCRATFGPLLPDRPDENMDAFLGRAREALLALRTP